LTGCEPARLSGPLPREQVFARLQACNTLFRKADGLAVIPFPGGRPGRAGVRIQEWADLSPSEQNELVDLTACLQSGGDIGPVVIEVVNSSTYQTLSRRRVSNDRDFAALVS